MMSKNQIRWEEGYTDGYSSRYGDDPSDFDSEYIDGFSSGQHDMIRDRCGEFRDEEID